MSATWLSSAAEPQMWLVKLRNTRRILLDTAIGLEYWIICRFHCAERNSLVASTPM